jgi:hypothetical protein
MANVSNEKVTLQMDSLPSTAFSVVDIISSNKTVVRNHSGSS